MKKKSLFKTAFAIGLVGFAPIIADSQEAQTKVHEIGIGFNSTSSFSLRYQWGTDEMLYRITAISLGGTNSYAYTDYTTTNTMPNNNNSSVATPITVNTPMNLNGGLNFSLAKIKSLNERFGFMYGAVIGANVAYQKSNTDYAYLNVIPPSNPSNYSTESISSSYAPFIGLLFGARYKMSSSFYLYAEVTPNFSYTYAKATSTSTPGAYTPFNTNKVTNTYGLSGLANSGAFITIVYRL